MGLEKAISIFESHISMNRQLAEPTVRAYLSRIQGFVLYLRRNPTGKIICWRQVDRPLAESFVKYLTSEGRLGSTVNLTTTSLRMFFDFLVLRGEAEANPFATPFYELHHARTPPAESHTLTDDDIRALVGAPEWSISRNVNVARHLFGRARDFGDYKAARDEAMIKLIFFAGLKTGEIASLPEEHFDRSSSVLLVSSGSKSRRVFLVSKAYSALAKSLDLKAMLFPDCKYAFLNKYGKRLSERSACRIVAEYASDRGIPADVCPGDLRRAFERRLIMVGAEEWLIRYLLGFEEYSFTEELIHAMRSALERVGARIEV
jgi:integrase/recombinase XerC